MNGKKINHWFRTLLALSIKMFLKISLWDPLKMDEINSLIKNFVMEYFEKIGCNIKNSDGVYLVAIPVDYRQIFNSENLHVTFEPEVSKITSAELIIPGSIILQKILMNCKSKSPITTAFAVNSDGNNGYAVRLFFDISIMGNEKYFEVITLDMDLKTHEKINFEPELEIFEKLDFAQIDSSGISKLFFKSIEEIRKITNKIEEKIFQKNNKLLDEMEKNLSLNNSKKIEDLQQICSNSQSNGEDLKNFDLMMDKIKILREQHENAKNLLKIKYGVIVNYDLFAATIFKY